MVRDPSFIDVIPDEKKGVFVDESEAAPRKLSLLKEKLKERFPVSHAISFSELIKLFGKWKLENVLDDCDLKKLKKRRFKSSILSVSRKYIVQTMLDFQ